MKPDCGALTRESAVWWILLALGLVTAIATLDTSTAIELGIPAESLKYLRLVAFLTSVGSTWAKTSPFPSRKDPQQFQRFIDRGRRR